MKITVIGCGRWGSLITWYLNRIGHEMTLYGLANDPGYQRFVRERRNDLLELPESIRLTDDLHSVDGAEVIIISVPSQALQGLMDELKPLHLQKKTFVLCMKGIEISSGRRLSEIVKENTDASNAVAVWVGPGHVQEFYVGHPSCMIIDSENKEVKHHLVDSFSSELIRFYYGNDLIGSEIGAASKNVIGIAAGFLDGLGLATLKGALMARAPHEISVLIEAMGGNPMSAYGLCHLGDYEATVFSRHSHNRAFGEAYVKGESFGGGLAEGYYTAKAMMVLAERYHVELPICEAVYRVLYGHEDVKEGIEKLFRRSLKAEFS